MSDRYRVVVLDADGREVGDVQTLRLNPRDVLAVMPLAGYGFDQMMIESLNEIFRKLGMTVIVFRHPVQFVRLERVE